jgi:hypothetical protein
MSTQFSEIIKLLGTMHRSSGNKPGVLLPEGNIQQTHGSINSTTVSSTPISEAYVQVVTESPSEKPSQLVTRLRLTSDALISAKAACWHFDRVPMSTLYLLAVLACLKLDSSAIADSRSSAMIEISGLISIMENS